MGRDRVGGDELEAGDEVGELVLGHLLAQGGVADQVGEAHGGVAATAVLDLDLEQLTAGLVLQVAPPHVVHDPRHHVEDQRGALEQRRLDLRRGDRPGFEQLGGLGGLRGDPDREGGDLGVGDARHRRADHPGHLQGELGLDHPVGDRGGRDAHHLEVGLGEEVLAVGRIGEAEGAPEVGDLLDGQPHVVGDLLGVEPGWVLEHEVLDGEQWQGAVCLGGGDLLFGHLQALEDLADRLAPAAAEPGRHHQGAPVTRTTPRRAARRRAPPAAPPRGARCRTTPDRAPVR